MQNVSAFLSIPGHQTFVHKYCLIFISVSFHFHGLIKSIAHSCCGTTILVPQRTIFPKRHSLSQIGLKFAVWILQVSHQMCCKHTNSSSTADSYFFSGHGSWHSCVGNKSGGRRDILFLNQDFLQANWAFICNDFCLGCMTKVSQCVCLSQPSFQLCYNIHMITDQVTFVCLVLGCKLMNGGLKQSLKHGGRKIGQQILHSSLTEVCKQ